MAAVEKLTPTKKPAKAAESPASYTPRVPLGVYLSRSREVAVAIRHTKNGIWFLTMMTAKVTCQHCSDDKFLHDFPLVLPGYPVRRAIRRLDDSGLARDEHTQKIITRLLESL